MTYGTHLWWAADSSAPNIYSVWVQALVVVGLVATGVLTLLQIRRGRSSSEPASSTSSSTQPDATSPSSSEPALIMLINQNEARSKQLERDLQRARAQRERDISEIATLKAELEDVKADNMALIERLESTTTDLKTALAKAETLAERLEYLERLINRK